jgi:proteasome assembly chaperone (PAC2) family protein
MVMDTVSLLMQIEQLETENKRFREVIRNIREMTDVNNPDSYRSDDREGCLDAVFAEADRAITK